MEFFEKKKLLKKMDLFRSYKRKIDGSIVWARRIDGPFCIGYKSKDLYCSNGYIVMSDDIIYPVVRGVFESDYCFVE